MVAKLGKMVIYFNGLLFIKLLVKSRDVLKSYVYTTVLMAAKIRKIATYPWWGPLHKIIRPIDLRVLARSRDKLRPSYFHYYNIYDHKIWKDGDLPWVTITHKV